MFQHFRVLEPLGDLWPFLLGIVVTVPVHDREVVSNDSRIVGKGDFAFADNDDRFRGFAINELAADTAALTQVIGINDFHDVLTIFSISDPFPGRAEGAIKQYANDVKSSKEQLQDNKADQATSS